MKTPSTSRSDWGSSFREPFSIALATFDGQARARWRTRAWYVFAALMGALVLAEWSGIEVVYTRSIPLGVYMRHDVHERPLDRGDFACLEAWRRAAPWRLKRAIVEGFVPRAWAQGERLTKRVAGVAGDVITYVPDARGGHVAVNGVGLAASGAMERDRRGLELPRPPYPLVLGDDEVWLTSSDPRGFDSRYFGPVKLAALSCRAELLWAF